MTLHYDLNFNDYLEFNYYYLWARPERRFYRIANSALPLFVLLLLMYFFKGLNFDSYGPGELAFLILGILLFFLMPYIVKENYKNSVRRLLESGKNKTLLGSKSIILEDDKLTEVTAFSSSTLTWTAFECLKENKEYFFLFQNSNQAIIIPKRVLATDVEAESLRHFISSRLENEHASANRVFVK